MAEDLQIIVKQCNAITLTKVPDRMLQEGDATFLAEIIDEQVSMQQETSKRFDDEIVLLDAQVNKFLHNHDNSSFDDDDEIDKMIPISSYLRSP